MGTPDKTLIRILLVEDEPSIRSLCLRVLTAEGFEVDSAANGQEAKQKIELSDYDLCLIDIRTPAMNGEELYQWLKETRPQMAKRVVFTTGDVISGQVQDFLEKASTPFLPKPFTPEELRSIVKQVIKEV